MDPDTDVCQTEQPQISYSVDFTAEQSSAMGSPILLDREGSSLAALGYYQLRKMSQLMNLKCAKRIPDSSGSGGYMSEFYDKKFFVQSP